MVQPFQVRHEQPAEGARLAMNNRAFDVLFNPSAFLLPNTNFITGVLRHTKSAVSVVLPRRISYTDSGIFYRVLLFFWRHRH